MGDKGNGNGAAEPGESPSTARLIANRKLSRKSKYTVPSRICKVDGVVDLTMGKIEDVKMPADDGGEDGVFDACDDDSFTLSVRDSSQQRNEFQDYMPMYQDMCKLASAPGKEWKKCQAIMNVEIEKLKKILYSVSVDTSNDLTDLDCALHPRISNKRVAKRM